MWYAMWGAEDDDAASFERRVDNVVREIGERGKLLVAESVPPLREPTPSPAPSPAPAPASSSVPPLARAPARALAPAPATTTALSASASPSTTLADQQPDQESCRIASVPITPSVRSSMEHQPVAMQQPGSSSFAASLTGTTLMEVSAFMTEQLKTQMVEQRAHDKQQHTEVVRLLEGQLEAHREEIKLHRQELEKRRQELEGYHEQALEAKMVGFLQVRVEALHSAKLLDDEHLYIIEDIIADSETGDIRVSQLIALSDKMTSDKAFARQLRRKYC